MKTEKEIEDQKNMMSYADTLLNRFITLGFTFFLYSLGCLTVNKKLNLNEDHQEISTLRDKKTSLVTKINEYHRNIPLMKEEFAQQYHDSLTKALQDTFYINTKVSKLEAEIEQNKYKVILSWGYYLGI